MDAHNPYIPPEPFDTLFPGKDEDFDSVAYNLLYKKTQRLQEKNRSIVKKIFATKQRGGSGWKIVENHIFS